MFLVKLVLYMMSVLEKDAPDTTASKTIEDKQVTRNPAPVPEPDACDLSEEDLEGHITREEMMQLFGSALRVR